EFEVLLPMALQAPDLSRRIVDLIDTVRIEEHRPWQDVWEDLSSPYCDIVRARLLAHEDGLTLPLEDGAAAFGYTWDLLLAATGLKAASQGVRESAASGKIEALTRKTTAGISANFCDALAGLNRISHGIQFTFSWAPAQPAAPDLRTHFDVSADAVVHLEEAS